MFAHPVIRHDLGNTLRADALAGASRVALLEEPMNIDAHADALGHDLAAAAELGDERGAAAGEALARAARPALRIRMLDALSEAALEVSSQLPEGRVEVRLAGDEAQLVFVEDAAEASAP